MKITKTLSYPLPPHNLLEVLTNPDFIRSRLTPLGISPDIEINNDTQHGTRTVTTTTSVPAILFPQSAQRFLPETFTAIVKETFTPSGENSWRVATTLTLESLPVSAQATSTLEAHENGTQRHMSGDIAISIPFFGRTVEKMIADHADKACELEVESVIHWVK